MKTCELAAATAAAVTAAVLSSALTSCKFWGYCRVQQNGGLLSNHEVAQVSSQCASMVIKSQLAHFEYRHAHASRRALACRTAV
jgi:hypothetical protein